MENRTALAVVGQTASGKSALALELAQRLDGELVCMDSMQIYRRMDIGTAKPTAGERARVRHHMLDIVEPTDGFTVADYADQAKSVILDILRRGKTPILVGGTGLYLRAVMHGMALGGAGGDEAIRERYRAVADEPDGPARLHALLEARDPATAARLHPNDLRRVVRALEVYDLTGAPMSAQPTLDQPPPFHVLPVGLALPREALYRRINARVEAMLGQGLLREVRALLQSGVTAGMQSMQGIGYKELIPVAEGAATVAEAAALIARNTRRYAKRQGAFFRTEPAVRWLDAENGALADDVTALYRAQANR